MRLPGTRRSPAIAAGMLLLAAPVLTGCGQFQTDQVNTISAGVNNREGQVDVLGALVIAGQDDAGVFVATLVNKSPDNPATFTGIAGGEKGQLTPTEEFEATEIAPQGQLNLVAEGGIPVAGDFQAGDFVTVTVELDGGEAASLEVNVVPACRQFEDLVELPEATSSPSPTPSPSASEGEGAGEASDPYSCDPVESTVFPEGEMPHHGGGGE